jgi:hypothetical protein
MAENRSRPWSSVPSRKAVAGAVLGPAAAAEAVDQVERGDTSKGLCGAIRARAGAGDDHEATSAATTVTGDGGSCGRGRCRRGARSAAAAAAARRAVMRQCPAADGGRAGALHAQARVDDEVEQVDDQVDDDEDQRDQQQVGRHHRDVDELHRL